jgi:RNA polymerase sigma-70 factor (ECF subfamily)
VTDDCELPQNTHIGEHEEEEFSEFYRQDMPKLIAFAMRLGADISEARDVAQQAFVNAYPKWPTIRHRGAYLRTAASRELARRSSNNRRETPVAELPESVETSGPSIEKVELDDEAIGVVRAINGLPGRQREVMAWVLDGYAPAEIAQILGITPGTVRGSLLKARRELKVRLSITQGGDINA